MFITGLAILGAIWVATVGVFGFIVILIMRHDAEIEGCPDPEMCPGCDGFLEFDQDGSNICPQCGGTWWLS